ncbi:hypothetical protein F2P81_018497 [Scophthalmus maximus]|uniref:PDZ domain-containing protein n=1 Tax=Scophthalmus maximus TaxID=52904 RepID=A0A6A4SGA0_SCOMX|nr:hypothetical protein F2P81_018497 [Scophthalmus maximus]
MCACFVAGSCTVVLLCCFLLSPPPIPVLLQVEDGGRAFLAGVQEGDEVVSLNGEPCADLTLLRAFALIETSTDCMQLLLKRYCTIPPVDYESEETYCGERESSADVLASTTLHIFSPKHRSQSPRELYISESQDEAYYDTDTEFPKEPQQFSDGQRGPAPVFKEKGVQRCFSPGDMVEVQVSLSEQTLDDLGRASLGSARGIAGGISNREAVETIHTSTISQCLPCSVREPLGQHGLVLGSPSKLGQVEVILQQPSASGAGRGILSVGGPRVSGSVASQSEGEEEGGGHCEGVPGSFTVSFGIPTEEASAAGEQDSDSEGDPDKPNKHRARHSRLRRSESLSEKQVKEAKSKCKRIALLLTAAPPNPNNKGVLMFKKHRQRVKKYTLVSYGTGEDEPENSDEGDEEIEDEKQQTHTVEFTLVGSSDSEIDKHFLTNAHSSKGVLTINWDKGLLEIERNLNNQAEMECLPETKGKGAVMFAQRRLRMDEIAAEHEELRRQGIPVEGVPETEKKTVEHSYMQSATEGHTTTKLATIYFNNSTTAINEYSLASSSDTTSDTSSAFEMPIVRGKGADMFAKRQSRMEKFVVDSDTVEASKASRSTSPVASLPNEWKYSPNVRAPPSRAYNPMQSPSYPPAATKQPPQVSPSSKDKKKGKEKKMPAPKPLSVIEVMKHQPYQLNSSLFTFGPAVEATKTPPPKPDFSPPNPPVENQPISYGQMTPIQPTGTFNAPYPQQAYGMPMQPMIHDSQYQQTAANVYPAPNTYQQPPAGPYQQAYNQQYQQPAPPAYHPQAPQSSIPSYQQAPQVPHQPASSPAYLAAPSVPYQPQPPTAPKPKFTAKKSSAQALGRSYSLSPPARIPSTGQKSASTSSSQKPPTWAAKTVEKVHKPLSPWEAASRHPLGLVDEAFASQNLHQTLASNIHLAAQRKMLPEPPAEWKAGMSYQAPPKTGSQTWSQSQSRSHSRAPLPSFASPTKGGVSSAAGHAGYRSLPRQWQPQRSVTQANLEPPVSSSDHKRPLGKQTYKSVYTSNTWSWRRNYTMPVNVLPLTSNLMLSCPKLGADTAASLYLSLLPNTEMDLGKKMNVPKDIMLEELSLASNRGSRLFKMRQRRSEKYTFESVRNENNKQLNSMAFSQTESGNPADSHSGESDQPPKVPSDTPDTRMVPDPDSIAPGYGGPLKDVPPEKFNSTAVPKSYFSPWEQAISRDPALAGSFITCMPEPEPQPDLPGYKSFNRVATPFRGFGKAPRSATINLPQVDALPDFPELRGDAAVDRPSFNRAALGWVTVGGPVPLSAVTLEHALIPESEDL